MQFQQHYSGSTGNLYTLTSDTGKRLLIEAGVPWRKLLEAVNYDLSNIVGCIVTHDHADHSCAIPELIKTGITVYASEGTLAAYGLVGHRRTVRIQNKDLIKNLSDFVFFSFDTVHDAKEPLGFVVRDKVSGEYLLFVTDTSHIKQRFRIRFSIVAIECSYDRDILQGRVDAGTVNKTLAKRLLESHMERQNTLRYLKEFCNLSRCREIHLLHCSGENLDADSARIQFEKELFIRTITYQSVRDGADEVSR